MTYSVEIINKNSKKFRFQEGECQRAAYNLTSKLFKQSMIEGNVNSTIIINLGREVSVPVNFTLLPTDGDAAGGLHTSTVKTVQEKVTYLNDVFITNGLQDFYTVNLYATAAYIVGLTAVIENFNLDFASAKPNSMPGSMTFLVGGGTQV